MLLPSKISRLANQVQRVGAIAIIAGFKTIALAVAEAESSLVPVAQRWTTQRRRFWIDLHTLPKPHPFWKVRKTIHGTQRRHRSVLERTAEALKDVDLRNLECIQPFCLAPWQPRALVRIDTREQAIDVAKGADLGRTIFTDASSRGGRVAIGVTYQWSVAPRTVSKVVGSSATLGVDHAELMGIEEACQMMGTDWPGHDIYPRTVVTLFSDGQSALPALANPRQQSGQIVLRRITERMERIKAQEHTTVLLRWVPGHTGVPGNEHAHQLPYKATDHNIAMPADLVKMRSIALGEGAQATIEARKRFAESRSGHHTKNLDRALPGAHTRQLYDGLKREDAKVLAQLRTGRCGLNHYLHRIKRVESPLCEVCQTPETVRHFLIEFHRWVANDVNTYSHIPVDGATCRTYSADGIMNDSTDHGTGGRPTRPWSRRRSGLLRRPGGCLVRMRKHIRN